MNTAGVILGRYQTFKGKLVPLFYIGQNIENVNTF